MAEVEVRATKDTQDLADKVSALAKEYQSYKEQMEGQTNKDAQTVADLQGQGTKVSDDVAACGLCGTPRGSPSKEQQSGK